MNLDRKNCLETIVADCVSGYKEPIVHFQQNQQMNLSNIKYETKPAKKNYTSKLLDFFANAGALISSYSCMIGTLSYLLNHPNVYMGIKHSEVNEFIAIPLILTTAGIAGYKAVTVPYNYLRGLKWDYVQRKRDNKKKIKRKKILKEMSKDEDFLKRWYLTDKFSDKKNVLLTSIGIGSSLSPLGVSAGFLGLYLAGKYFWNLKGLSYYLIPNSISEAAVLAGLWGIGGVTGAALTAYSFCEMGYKNMQSKMMAVGGGLAGTTLGFGILLTLPYSDYSSSLLRNDTILYGIPLLCGGVMSYAASFLDLSYGDFLTSKIKLKNKNKSLNHFIMRNLGKHG